MIHDLKTWPEFFAAIVDGRKRFEIRRHDRPFTVGDDLCLREWDPGTGEYSGRLFWARVTYLTPAFLPKGFVALGIAVVL